MSVSSPSVPVAIIGMGCLFPKADNLTSFWANLKNGVDAITEVPPTHWRSEDFFDTDPKAADRTYAARGGFLSPVDFPALDFGISPNTLEATDTTQLLGLVAAKQALEDAGYGAGKNFDRNRVSVILGVTGALELVIPLGARLGHPLWRKALKESGVGENVAEEVVRRISDSYVNWQEDSFPGLLGNVAAGRIANRLDLGGTNCVVDAACASSLSAMHLGILELSSGRADMVLTGGLDTFNDIFMYMCFSKTPALSPTGDARPFDAKADGTILGEGLGILVLKRLPDAERDGDKVYAVIRGVGSSSDGKGNAIYAPSPAGQAKALRRAYRLAEVTPDTIELVEAHGTGTKAGDAAEIAALTEVYHSPRTTHRSSPWCALGTVKSQIGHTKAAAGAAGLIKAALALHHKVLPPTIRVNQPIDSLGTGKSPFYLNTEKRPWLPRREHPRRAAVSSFGFGGSNFHCVLEEHRPEKMEVDWDGDVQILAFSEDTRETLSRRLSVFPQRPSWEELRIHAFRSRADFRGAETCRLLLVIEREKTDVSHLLARARKFLEKREFSWNLAEGIYFRAGPALGKLGFVFPGQGSQYVGMLRELACMFPQMRQALTEADAVFAGEEEMDARRLSDFIFPQPVFRDEDRTKNEEMLRATEVAQPALGAVSLGALRVLQELGVQPDAVAGHSYGELVALCAAGRLDATGLHSLSKMRGKLMGQRMGDGGSMLAVFAPLEKIEMVLKEERLSLVVANKNAPRQSVLSGVAADIRRAAAAFEKAGVQTKQLPVAGAFHSPLVAGVQPSFRKGLDEVAMSPGKIPVFANTTANEYPHDEGQAKELLAEQLAKSVEFVQEIENLYRYGVWTFLEVGPGNKLTGMIGAILEGREHAALSLDASGGKRPGATDLAHVLAQLAALGHPVRLTAWDEPAGKISPAKKPALTIPICGANYVKPKPVPAVTPMANRTQEPAAKNVDVSNRTKAVGLQPMPESKSERNAKLERSSLDHAWQTTQENLMALQKLGEQTAQLHRQFLEGQDKALELFKSLLEQQRQLVQGPVEKDAGRMLRAKTTVSDELPASSVPEPVLSKAMQESAAPAPLSSPSKEILLAVVSEKTGYPPDMLELDMELDADLGIDSIKRVEIFSSLQEQLPQAPAVKPEHLGTLRTLGQVVAFLDSGQDSPSEKGETASPEPPRVSAPATLSRPIEQVLLGVVSEKTGYPAEMLELDMELDSDLGIDSIKRVEIFSALQENFPEAPPVKAEHLGALRTLRQVVEFLGASNGQSEKGSGARSQTEFGNEGGTEDRGERTDNRGSRTEDGDSKKRGAIRLDSPSSILHPPSSSLSLVFERDLNVENVPVLKSHVIDGRAVFPLALSVEWLAHAALHGNPGLTFCGLQDLRLLKGFQLEEDQSIKVRALAGNAKKEDGLFVVPVEMGGLGKNGREFPHARAHVVLAQKIPAEEKASCAIVTHPYEPVDPYRDLLFHGPDLQGIERVEGCSQEGIAAWTKTAPPASAWIKEPLRQSWLADPLALDCAFQLMILWTWEHLQAASLPCFLGRYRQFRRSFPQDGARVVAKVTKVSGNTALANIEFLDRAGKLIARLEDYDCVLDASLKSSFRRNRLEFTVSPSV